MADGIDKRLRYFDGELLQAQDFTDEQAYHLDRQRRHNRTLHTAGIAEGLTVTAEVGTDKAEVGPGTAVDGEGRQIVLTSDQTVDAKPLAGKTALLLISYHEESSDSATRWHERPRLEALPEDGPAMPPPDTHVRLARLHVDSAGTITQVDTDVRVFAGALQGSGAPQLRDLKIDGDLTVAGSGHFGGNVGIGTETPEAKLDVGGEIRAPFFRAGQGYRAIVDPRNRKWYRIAQVTPPECGNAEFTLRDTSETSPGFSSVTFRVGAALRDSRGISFTLLSHSWWVQAIFTKARLVYRLPARVGYSILYLEIYLSRNLPVPVEFSIYDNLQNRGWRPINWLEVPAELPVVEDPPFVSHEFDLDRLLGVGDTEDRFSVARGGNVGVGTATPQAKLEVSGGDIRVTGGNFIADGGTLAVPDQVLEANYPLMSLGELRQFIDQEGHLPDVPSAKEIRADGLNLSEFQMKLLKKVEELTLYTLEQQQTLQQLQAHIVELQGRLANEGAEGAEGAE